MEKICLTKEGIILKKDKPVTDMVFSFLSHTLVLEPGFTLASFFNLVANYPELLKMSKLLDALLAMANTGKKQFAKTHEIEGLIFYKTIAMKGFPGKPSIQIYNCLKGIKENETHALKFFQMESLLEHELILGDLKHIIFGDGQDMFTYETFYSLFELIEGITWEMSFNFNPLQCSIRG
ncbi:MAG: hypothetical protein KKF12_00690 [Proteobacteria bacterium]|nr:hypothetical protein [Desulfobacula sp.]MBU4129315.1 hypothetical protein [Pseudomonadota bacterium]